MGMFDSVWADCPNDECDGAIEWQSKAMEDAHMRRFPLDEVPVAVAADIDHTVRECRECGRLAGIQSEVTVPRSVPMVVVSV